MLEHAGRLVSREAIIEALWPNIFVTDDSLTQCVHDVRHALGRESRHLLRTIPRRGYIFEAGAVRREPRPSTPVADFPAVPTRDVAGDHGQLASTGDTAAREPNSAVRRRSSTEWPVRLSVLVLPLRSLSGSDAHERLADSITGDIVIDLAKYLKILAPGQGQIVFHDDRLAHWRTAPPDCKANYVLRGSVQGTRRTGVSLQLMDAASGVCIFAERCELRGQRDQIAQLVHAISIMLVEDVGHRVEALTTPDSTPRDLIMQGRAWLDRPASAYNRRQALGCFERAVAEDPDSVGSRLGIATVLASNLTNGWSRAIEQDEARTEALLTEVFQAGADNACAHSINGALRRVQGRLDASRVELEMTMDLAPDYSAAESQLGVTLIFLGQPEAALPHLERSVRPAAHTPQMALFLSNLGLCRLLLGDLDTAADRLREAELGNPQHFGAPLLLAAAHGLKSASAEASAALQRLTGLAPAFGTLSGLRKWVTRQAGPDFIPIYKYMIERGLKQAGMSEE
jgi:TolB-like protein